MNWGPIPDGDNLYRHSVFPPSFKGKVFNHEKLWRLVDETSNAVVTSLAWERYLPTSSYIHKYGCALAFERNERKRTEGKYEEKGRQVYCGAYQINAQAIRTLVGTLGLPEIVSADIVHDTEKDKVAHASLKVTLVSTTVDIEGAKTVIIDRLWNGTRGPLRHICDCDKGVDPHPNSDLITAPAGERIQSLSWFSRVWYLIRFAGHMLWLRIFCQDNRSNRPA